MYGRYSLSFGKSLRESSYSSDVNTFIYSYKKCWNTCVQKLRFPVPWGRWWGVYHRPASQGGGQEVPWSGPSPSIDFPSPRASDGFSWLACSAQLFPENQSEYESCPTTAKLFFNPRSEFPTGTDLWVKFKSKCWRTACPRIGTTELTGWVINRYINHYIKYKLVIISFNWYHTQLWLKVRNLRFPIL